MSNRPDNLYVEAKQLLDAKLGPYFSTDKACEVIPKEFRQIGQDVKIYTPGGIVEYWWKNGIEDSDLILKELSSVSEKYIGISTIHEIVATGTVGTNSLVVTDLLSYPIGDTLSVGSYIQLESAPTIYLIDAIDDPAATNTTLTLHTVLIDDPAGGKIRLLGPYSPFNDLLIGDNLTLSVSQNVATISATGGGGGGSGTVTSVDTAGLISGGPITTSGTITTSMSTNKLVGRSSAGTGIMEQIAIGSGLTLSGGTLTNSSPFTTPLTTKGDIYVRNGSADTRLPVGLDTQVLLADSTATTGLKWGSNTAATPTGYYGAWQDNYTQTAAANNTGYAMIFRTIDLSNGVSIVTNGTALTRITFANTGIYNIQFSSQFQNNSNQLQDVTIWLRKNGTDIPGSSGYISIPNSHGGIAGHNITGWNYVLSIVAGEYYELMWSTTDYTNVTMQYYTAGNPPPSTASVILTVTQQSGIMAGTGITAINSLTDSAQTITTGTAGTDIAITSSAATHTLNIPTASSTKRGALSSTDWSTFNGKQDAITGAATTITSSNLTASRVLVSDSSGKVSANTVTTTTLSYLDATSSIQTQINALPRVVYTNYTAETTTSTSTTNALTTFTLTIADANWPLGGVLRLSGLIERTAGSGSTFMGLVCNGSTARYFSAAGQNMQWDWQIMKEAASTLRIGMGPSNTGNGSYAVHNVSTVTATASGGNYVFTFYMFVGTSGATASMRWMKGVITP